MGLDLVREATFLRWKWWISVSLGASPDPAPRDPPHARVRERSDLRSAGGYRIEESVICNHGFGTNLTNHSPRFGILQPIEDRTSPSRAREVDPAGPDPGLRRD